MLEYLQFSGCVKDEGLNVFEIYLRRKYEKSPIFSFAFSAERNIFPISECKYMVSVNCLIETFSSSHLRQCVQHPYISVYRPTSICQTYAFATGVALCWGFTLNFLEF